MSIIT